MNDHQKILWSILRFAANNEQSDRVVKVAADFTECEEGRCMRLWCRQQTIHAPQDGMRL